MPAEQIARRRYRARQLLAARTTAAASAVWDRIDPNNIAASWAREVPALTATVTLAQRTAADTADEFVDAALATQGLELTADAAVNAVAFGGIASDGRALRTLLASPAYTTLRQIAAGARPDAALTIGRGALSRIVGTQVADAGRVADGVAVFARPGAGYIRHITTPSCARCAILAGRVYRSDEAFDRHPRCDCIHVPVADTAGPSAATDTRRYFDSLSTDDQDRIFTNAGADAIRDGADINQVVNARRGMNPAGFTSEGLTRRGAARRAQNAAGVRAPHPMPETIYELADGNRERALELLQQHGYLA